jgi:hypothetical protein
LVDPPPLVKVDPPGSQGAILARRLYAIGDAWFCTKREDGLWHVYPDTDWPVRLAPEYDKNNASRPPLMVVLPGGTDRGYPFCVDGPTWSEGGPGPHGWTVSGTPPGITVKPSINIVGQYHGWIRDGSITPDCEGRKF